MNATVIVLIVIGVIIIAISFALTSDEVKETVNPNVPTELTDADKKHLDKLVDTHMNEYSKKKVKETVGQNVKSLIEAESGKIDERAQEDTQKLEQYYNEVTADIDRNKEELSEMLKKVGEKEKEFKKSLSVVDEYQEGLAKLKEDLKSMEESVSAKKAEMEKLISDADSKVNEVNAASENAVASVNAAATTAAQAAVATTQAAATTAQAAEAPAEPVNTEGETEVLRGPVMDAAEVEETPKQSKKFGKKNKKNKKGKKNEAPVEEAPVEEAPVQEAPAEEVKEAPVEEAEAPASSNVETPELDEMLQAEGISLTEGDTVGNIMEMFNAGFSIIEISKVLGIGVGEVKAVIDKQQG